ncbi:hypothetical protein NQ314_012799 [Rhamnusium bicolor]|uniref:PNPLA domain-containing protein n=1 Tax=Rhamnusium bicolor TaxID=1586634 RepID=A0AAV8X9X6_9CUCU|nr:hypothetical protein NQ314_012799 [Rhamnusium bicolor]
MTKSEVDVFFELVAMTDVSEHNEPQNVTLSIHRHSLDEISYGYEKISNEVFKQSSWRGTEIFCVQFLQLLINTVICICFLKLLLPWKFQSQYLGINDCEIWQAANSLLQPQHIFEEFKLGNLLHQDGGILVNNPTAIALMNATDTEAVHTMLNDLLPDNVYYHFNPYLTEMISMVETDSQKLEQLRRDAIMYLRRNEDKFQEVAKVLMQKKKPTQKVKDYIKVQKEMEGF